MRTIIAGSRTYHDYNELLVAIEVFSFRPTVVISGGCLGVDKLGERWAKETNTELEIFHADWDTYGKAAGPVRNKAMAVNAGALIALWDGKSKGTKNMIVEARKQNLVVYIHKI